MSSTRPGRAVILPALVGDTCMGGAGPFVLFVATSAKEDADNTRTSHSRSYVKGPVINPDRPE